MTLILIPLVLAGIYYLPPIYFSLIVVGLLGIMMYEWQQFIQLPELENPYIKYIILILGVLLVMKFWTLFIYLDVLFWLFAIVAVIAYPKYQDIWGSSSFITINAWILLGVFGAILNELQMDTYGKDQLVALLFLVWAADIGAYLVGRRWGQHKMIPQVSPGKSWEGLFGGVLFAMAIATIETVWLNPFSNAQWFVVAFLTILISVIGDLWMSVLKRKCQLKDTGHLIPGHGGILDRLDSLLAALPIFYFGLNF
jgi:phosphatidate cytidylyltransferase